MRNRIRNTENISGSVADVYYEIGKGRGPEWTCRSLKSYHIISYGIHNTEYRK